MNQGGALVWRECYVQKLWQEENDLFARLAALRRVSREHRSDYPVDTIAILIKVICAAGLLAGAVAALAYVHAP